MKADDADFDLCLSRRFFSSQRRDPTACAVASGADVIVSGDQARPQGFRKTPGVSVLRCGFGPFGAVAMELQWESWDEHIRDGRGG